MLVSEDKAYSPGDYSPSRRKDDAAHPLTPSNSCPPATEAARKTVKLLVLL